MKKRALSLGLMAIGMIVASLFTAAPAMAQVPTCAGIDSASHTYPRDTATSTSHAQSCLPAGYSNPVGGTKAAIENAVFGEITALPTNNGTGTKRVRDFLKDQGVKVFIFKNRSEANAYFNATPPYQGQADQVFSSSTARCGQTGYHPTVDIFGSPQQDIAIAVYAECTIAGADTPNPSVSRTAGHEGGHAFEFALASTKSSNRTALISQSPGYTKLVSDDKGKLTPADWGTRTDQSKNSYICGAWSTTKPSALEFDLGASTAGGPAGQNPDVKGAICMNSTTPYSPYKWPGGQAPQAIISAKIPYFYSSSKELWAEQFEIKKDGIGSPATFLQMTDRIINSTQGPVPNFNCSKFALMIFYDFSRAPTSQELQGQSCDPNPGSFNF